MPLYTVTTEDGFLSDNQRDLISTELVRLHTAATGVPANFVHTIFSTYPKGRAYVAGQIASVASVMGVVRAGRSTEVKARLIKDIWAMFQDVTGASDADLSVALQDVPASQAMENGKIMPEIGASAGDRLAC